MPAPSAPPASDAAPQLAMPGEWQRKALHLLTALVVPVGMVLFGRIASIFTLGLLAALAVTADVLRARWAPFATFIHRAFGSMMRPEELPDVPGPVVVNGATWVLVAGFLLAVLVPVETGALVFVAFLVADAAAALVGRTWGRHPWRDGRRTLEGSGAFAVTAFALLAALPSLAPALDPMATWKAGLVALAMAWLEAAPWRINDNVLVPTLGSLLVWHLGAF